ncbi:MAG: PBP1A family penicillin-binding protein [Alphaproteobacteria bacterium]|nr:PBP1A family penicillin-binding protein [Alphaproteobacteria bacterium]MBU0799002.1 PBP1A family penicillin-binding protein [Alphaproteobacteria bacterium]MBU0889232.1 PBP1A family penicillin-binding protein [Alphaproteobacteria bacterium]MBU1815048.1 PBP1A family penicillin-binding protein [Alphaproteobacteria bacterium]
MSDKTGGKMPGMDGQDDRRWRSRLRAALHWRNLLLAATTGLAVLLLVLGYFAFTLPLPETLSKERPDLSLTLRAADGERFGARGEMHGEYLTVAQMPPEMAQAIVAIEDRRFYEHIGIDIWGIGRAAMTNVAAGGIRQGGSTLTQQLAKMRFLTPERSFKRKIQEAMLALWLESRLTKDQILALYLNEAYYGAGAYGIDAAARRYFGKSARGMTLAESAMLAGLVRAPSALSPVRSLEAATKRADQVLAAMVETGAIPAEAAEAARMEKVTLAVPPEVTPGRNYFADWVASEGQRLLGPIGADLTVETTLDLQLQDLAEQVVAANLGGAGPEARAGQAALVALRPDGSVVAMVGGRNYAESQFNRAVQATRQPGSAFKLFVYLAALDAGMTPNSRVLDAPVDIKGYTPQNYGNAHIGATTLRNAFARSINTVAVKLADQVGPDRVIGVARRLGITTEMQPTPSLALGTFETRLIELTAAYAAMAANAEMVEPFGIKVIHGQGRTLYTKENGLRRASGPFRWKRAEMVEMLGAVVSEGTGRAAMIGQPSYGKTGTTQDNRDAVFVGFTKDYVVGVWVGNDDHSPMNNVTGGGVPARIWRDFMSGAYRIYPAPEPVLPAPEPLPAPVASAAPPIVEQPASPPPQEPTQGGSFGEQFSRDLKKLGDGFRSLFD